MDTVSAVCSADYDPEQIAAWSSSVEDSERWLNIMTKQVVVVAKISGLITGFATLANGNYIDLMYVHMDHQGKGIAGTLYQYLEHVALQNDQTELYADVSKTALPFFQHMGFTIERQQTVVRKGVELTNFRMRKLITNPGLRIYRFHKLQKHALPSCIGFFERRGDDRDCVSLSSDR